MQDENKKLRRELAEGYGRAAGTRPEYAASYEKELSGVYDSMKNRPEFSYDANSDGLYRQYRDGYIQRGRMAMKDTMGQAAALTGGYGSSYAESAAQQQYDAYLQQLGDIVPELYTLAYSRYQDEGDALQERYDMLSGLRDREYGEYTDAMDRGTRRRRPQHTSAKRTSVSARRSSASRNISTGRARPRRAQNTATSAAMPHFMAKRRQIR